jgi:hypothetical protein
MPQTPQGECELAVPHNYLFETEPTCSVDENLCGNEFRELVQGIAVIYQGFDLENGREGWRNDPLAVERISCGDSSDGQEDICWMRCAIFYPGPYIRRQCIRALVVPARNRCGYSSSFFFDEKRP